MRLNRRLAPDVYLGVEPVRRGRHGHDIGGSGPVVDWAVHMRRLPDDASAAALLARGRARPRRALAGARGAAGRVPGVRAADARAGRAGGPARQRRRELRAGGSPSSGDLVDRGHVRRGARVPARAARPHSAIVSCARRARGASATAMAICGWSTSTSCRRRGDGDRSVIDCIEFNERFRCGDAAGEVAFLAMELEAARRPDLAAGFLARFAEASDDFGLYGVARLLPFVPRLGPGQGGGVRRGRCDGGRGVARAQARRGAAPASRSRARSRARPSTRRSSSPSVASSAAARARWRTALGRELAAPVVSSDRMRKALAGLAPTERGDALYAPERSTATTREVLRRAAGFSTPGAA